MRSHSPRSSLGSSGAFPRTRGTATAERHETGRDRGGQQRQQPRVGEEQHDHDRDERRLADEVDCAQPPESQRDADGDRIRLLNGGDNKSDPRYQGSDDHRPVVPRPDREHRRREDPEYRDAQTDPDHVREQAVPFTSVLGREFTGGDVRDTGFGEAGDNRDQRRDDHVSAEVLDAQMPRHQRSRGDSEGNTSGVGDYPQDAPANHPAAGGRRIEDVQRVVGWKLRQSAELVDRRVGAAHAESTSSSLAAPLPSRL